MRLGPQFVTSKAAWRWNKMLQARENVDSLYNAVEGTTPECQ